MKRDVVLIGASAGGIEALKVLLGELGPAFRGRVAITLHRSSAAPSLLKPILASRSSLGVVEPKTGESFHEGMVYVAPADHHLTFVGPSIRLTGDPKENYSRPAIDVMFRSGAQNFGSRVAGVVLTGHLRDGVAGLVAIKRHGGISLAQEPTEAAAPSMPVNAIAHDHVDIVFRLGAAAEVLRRLAEGEGVERALEVPGARVPFERGA